MCNDGKLGDEWRIRSPSTYIVTHVEKNEPWAACLETGRHPMLECSKPRYTC
jgi:hypothetical protein